MAKIKTLPQPQMQRQDRMRYLRAASIISSALPYAQRYAGKPFVIKYGGNAMVDPKLAQLFAQDVVLLKQVGIHPIVVHGGGPQIDAMLKRLQLESEFIDGLRVTDAKTAEVVEMVLAGTINKEIVSAINLAGGQAIGLCGKDANLLRAEKLRKKKKDEKGQEVEIDLGFVGDPVSVNTAALSAFMQSGMIPVIAPVALGADGHTYNINADTVAGALAAALKAVRMLLLTDVPGVLDKDGKLVTELDIAGAKAMIGRGDIKGGMIPKIETCFAALQGGVEAAVIIDGRLPHAVLLEVFTEHGAGTLMKA